MIRNLRCFYRIQGLMNWKILSFRLEINWKKNRLKQNFIKLNICKSNNSLQFWKNKLVKCLQIGHHCRDVRISRLSGQEIFRLDVLIFLHGLRLIIKMIEQISSHLFCQKDNHLRENSLLKFWIKQNLITSYLLLIKNFNLLQKI